MLNFNCLLVVSAAAQELGEPPNEDIARIVDAVAAQFVAARGRGFEGKEPPLLKQAASAYREKVSKLDFPWPVDEGSSEFVPPRTAPKIPNICHWAWRSGDADFTLALSVVMAALVQKPERLLIHTGPTDEGTFSQPQTLAGHSAFKCLKSVGVEEIFHSEDPSPDGEHPWAEVLRKKRLSKQTFAHVSDVMRLFTIVQWGGIYLDRDAFLHLPVDHYRWHYDAVVGLDPETYEGDRDVNFGAFMARPNATYFRLLWDGMGREDYRNLSYRVTWGGWAHDSCRKSFALAIKRPDLVHVDERLYQFPFPGKSAARGGHKGKNPPALLAKAKTHEILHMSGFEWHSLRNLQLTWSPSIFGTVVWPNVLLAIPPEIAPELRACLAWLQSTLLSRGYIHDAHDFA